MYQLTEKLEQMIKLFDYAIYNNLFFKFIPLPNPNPNPNSHIKEYQKLTLTLAEVAFVGKITS